jgi:hypothetical protein
VSTDVAGQELAALGITRTPTMATYGLSYNRDNGTTLYADMHGGWTPEQLRAIADDVERHQVTRAKAAPIVAPIAKRRWWQRGSP